MQNTYIDARVASKRPMTRLSILVLALSLQACVQVPEDLRRDVLQEGDVPIVLSTSPTPNHTPMTHKLICYGEQLKASGRSPVSIAVGNIRDYTGKQGDAEGYLVTQGGSLMAYTALGHVAPGITIMERFDTSIADAELAYLSNRQLGDGNLHDTVDPNTGEDDQVPWMPYYGGSIIQSDYYIVGGVTELNFNIQSGGGEFAINNLGGKARIYTMNVGIDLRIVGSQSLKVYDTVSYQKQISGYEVGLDIFRFFDNDLWDVYSGAKNQEPLQLAVRMAIESGILEILPTVTKVVPRDCDPTLPMVKNQTSISHGTIK
jgi:curli production assembly/transport component CsgG/holdfast attachment protein HfaB